MVGIPWGGGDTQAQPYAKEYRLYELNVLTGGWDAKPLGTCTHADH